MIERTDSPDSADERANAKGLKLHLRVVTVGRTTFRIVTLRPATSVRFSTNFFHDTWHVLTDREGAFILARLLWGLAFQREPGTAVLLDGVHLVPTPFEADPGDPVLLAPAGLTRVDAAVLRLLRARLRQPTSQKTVRWHTFGLPQALAENVDWRASRYLEARSQRSQERMDRLGGFVCYSAPRDVLRSQALAIYRMRECKKMSYHYLAEDHGPGWWRTDGEVQVFRDFRDMVSAATVARRAVLDAHGPGAQIRSDSEREAVYRQAELAGDQLRASRRRKKEGRAALGASIREREFDAHGLVIREASAGAVDERRQDLVAFRGELHGGRCPEEDAIDAVRLRA
jgi:hypothetical protein